MKALVVENFFSNFENIKDHFKKIPLYDLDTFNKEYAEEQQAWPGHRSDDLARSNPFLFNLVVKELYEKFGKNLSPHLNMSSYLHLRLAQDDQKDWIHTDDKHHLSLLVYLSETNLKSGTCLYEKGFDSIKNEEPSMTVNFVQNRALLFDSSTYHKSMLNYGNNLDTGRLTLNCFIRND